ncbi:MAG: TadE/TadG family type IV pilus assembly protein [Massilia sp.]
MHPPLRSRRGSALVEFALLLPFLLLLSIMVIELGRAVQRYNATAKTVRDAVRYLSTQTPGTHVTEARNLIVYGNTAGTGSPLDPKLTASNVPTPTWQTAGASPLINTVTIRVTGYTFQPMLANVFGTSFPTITYSDISATMRSPI